MGIALNTWGNHTASEVVELARLAEELGFERVWVGEHVVAPIENVTEHPYQAGILRKDQLFYDIWSVLGAISACTTRIGIGTGIYVLPMRHPLLSAVAAVTLQSLSKGRFILGMGAGWKKEEFLALGADFDRRGQYFDEMVDLLRELWKGGPVTHRGNLYSLPKLSVSHEPVNVPLVFGGGSPAAIRRAATRGDGWYNPSSFDLEKCVEVRGQIDEMRRKAGRGTPFSYHLRIGELSRSSVERARDAGFESVVVPWTLIQPLGSADLDTQGKLRALRSAASELGLRGA